MPEPRPAPGPPGTGAAPEPPPKVDPAAVGAAVAATPGTGRYYSATTVRATVSGLTGLVEVVAFTGEASWGGYTMVSGRWFGAPGEAVVPTPFLTATGTRVGDTVTLSGMAEPVTVRIVGEVLDPRNDGMQVFTDVASVAAAHPDPTPTSHHIAVAPGTDVPAYVEALNARLAPLGATAQAGGLRSGGDMVVTLRAPAALLTLVLVAVAAPGVALHGRVLPAMADGVGLRLPASVIDVYGVGELLPLALGGLLIAALGALLPAVRAARTRTATALRTE